MNAVINLRVSIKPGIFFKYEDLLASWEGRFCMEVVNYFVC